MTIMTDSNEPNEPLDWAALWDGHRYRVQTRAGYPVNIFTTEAQTGPHPVIGEYQGPDGTWFVDRWTSCGRAFMAPGGPEQEHDLVPETRTVRRWMNVYREHGRDFYPGYFWKTKKLALWSRGQGLVATIQVEWEENRPED